MVLWFVVSYNAWFVTSLSYKRGNKPSNIRETTNHRTMNYKRGNKPGNIRETTNHGTMNFKRGNKPGIIR
jgi:hypothetical protein